MITRKYFYSATKTYSRTTTQNVDGIATTKSWFADPHAAYCNILDSLKKDIVSNEEGSSGVTIHTFNRIK